MNRWFVAKLFLGFPSLIFAQDYYKPGPTTAVSSVLRLVQHVAPSQPRNLDELISLLPRELVSSPTFVYRSQSVQTASMKSPRALLSDASGDLVLAFNGDPGQRGHDVIEAMEFDHAQARFSFYEIGFISGALNVSAPNPERCLTCHRGAEPKTKLGIVRPMARCLRKQGRRASRG